MTEQQEERAIKLLEGLGQESYHGKLFACLHCEKISDIPIGHFRSCPKRKARELIEELKCQ